MDRLEIATRILCSLKDCTEYEALVMADNLIELANKKVNDAKERYNQMRVGEIDLQNVGDISQRTAERTQQLIDLGFEPDEDLIFTKDKVNISPKLIGEYNDTEWNEFLGSFNRTATVQEVKQSEPIESNFTVTATDFFKGNHYIEFEMDNSICRLYKLSESLDEKNLAERDLTTKTGAKAVSKDIISSSENKEFELGITIFKK